MRNNNNINIDKIEFISIYIYLVLQFILYILLHTTNIFNYDIGCYSVIICGVLISWILAVKSKNKIFYLIVIAQCFTLVSDTCLVLLEDYYNLAMVSFCFTQISYYIYILLSNSGYYKQHKFLFYLRLSSVSLCLFFYLVNLIFQWGFDFLPFISLFYFSLLVLNIFDSIFTFKKNPFLTIGLVLFMLCDICVGFYNLVDMFNISKDSLIYIISHSKVDWVWIFYHPSQVILSLIYFFDYKK